jgi:uncharacterized membrane protein
MNQSVYNTYKAIKEKNPKLILELTDPDSSEQIKRMAIHNDLLLVLIAPFYFIHAGPETLLVIQTVVLALGAVTIYLLAKKILANPLLPLIFAIAYLLYPAMQRANIFDFHAGTFATTFLLFMFYFWLAKKYWWSFLFFILSILSKEQVGLTTAIFGIYTILNLKFQKNTKNILFSLSIITISIIWVFLSFSVIIPYFRGAQHFAVVRYGDFGDSPLRIIEGIIKNPYTLSKYIFRMDTFNYFFFLLGPLSFFSLLSPIQLLISLPEVAINLLSNSWNMRNIIFHYTAVIQPFVFIAAIYGVKKLIRLPRPPLSGVLAMTVLIFTILFSYFKGPLPFSREQEIHPFKYPQPAAKEVEFWANTLKDDNLKISATGQVAPHFSSREYLYLFSDRYVLADYVVIRPDEIYNYPEKTVLIPVYQKLIKDAGFEKIYKSGNLEVYKKI